MAAITFFSSAGAVMPRSRSTALPATGLTSVAPGDHQWIHVDVERARRESPFGATIAHGFLTLSLLSRFVTNALEFGNSKMGINYGCNRLRLTAPVKRDRDCAPGSS